MYTRGHIFLDSRTPLVIKGKECCLFVADDDPAWPLHLGSVKKSHAHFRNISRFSGYNIHANLSPRQALNLIIMLFYPLGVTAGVCDTMSVGGSTGHVPAQRTQLLNKPSIHPDPYPIMPCFPTMEDGTFKREGATLTSTDFYNNL